MSKLLSSLLLLSAVLEVSVGLDTQRIMSKLLSSLLLLSALALETSVTSATPLDVRTALAMAEQPMEYYVASGPDDDCARTDGAQMGVPFEDACAKANAMDSLCVCVKKPAELIETEQQAGMNVTVNTATGFVRDCGKCYDPCAPIFKPDFFNAMNVSAVAAFGEDLIKMRAGVSFFKASGPADDCASVPAEVSKTPVIEACNGVGSSDSTMCVCLQLPESSLILMRTEGINVKVNNATGYANECGICHDRCKLKLIPTDMPFV